jgi:hypothetical protein
MRTTLIIVVVLLIAVAGYAYSKNPAGCAKVGSDIVAVAQSLWTTPVAPAPGAAPSSQPVADVPAVNPALTSSPAPAPVSAKTWRPPAVIPAQPNWTWTTFPDSKTYQNVVINKIEPDTVSINHSMGVAHIPISTLPPDIQKQLNYDPVAAEAARAESQRESDHPYYTMANQADAQAVAKQMQWPLAWVSSRKEDLLANATQDDETLLTQLALNYLKDKAIIIFLDNNNEIGQTPAIVHHQFSQYDDGAAAKGANYLAPKVVFSTPDASRTLGRVSFTQMKAGGSLAIGDVLDSARQQLTAPPTSP